MLLGETIVEADRAILLRNRWPAIGAGLVIGGQSIGQNLRWVTQTTVR